MRRKLWPLLAVIAALIGIGGIFFLMESTILHIENIDHRREIRLWISPSEKFSTFYLHSIYKEPVTEEFQVEKDAIVLKGVRTKSPGVMEYYGFEDTKEFHPVNLRLGAVFIIRRGMGEGQGLIVKDRKIYLSEIAKRGDRIQLKVQSIPLGEYLFKNVFK